MKHAMLIRQYWIDLAHSLISDSSIWFSKDMQRCTFWSRLKSMLSLRFLSMASRNRKRQASLLASSDALNDQYMRQEDAEEEVQQHLVPRLPAALGDELAELALRLRVAVQQLRGDVAGTQELLEGQVHEREALRVQARLLQRSLLNGRRVLFRVQVHLLRVRLENRRVFLQKPELEDLRDRCLLVENVDRA